MHFNNSHLNLNGNVCPVCGRKFMNQRALQAHIAFNKDREHLVFGYLLFNYARRWKREKAFTFIKLPSKV